MTVAGPSPKPSIGETLQSARRRLNAAAFEPSIREATLLMSHVLGLGEATVLAHPERSLDTADQERFEGLMRRRLEGEPTAYLLGEREFYGRSFAVDSRVLIPRPETEHLIDEALALELASAAKILDIGTGSGVIALTLALELATARIVGTDCSTGALAVAAANSRRWGLDHRVDLVSADLATGLSLVSFDLVVSNPPYIAPGDEPELSVEITRFEPHLALFAPPDGLAVARRLLAALSSLRAGCWLLMEIGAGQRGDLAAAAQRSVFDLVRVADDYAGIPRIAVLRRH